MLLAEAFLIHWRLPDSGFRSWLVRVMAFTCEGWGKGVGSGCTYVPANIFESDQWWNMANKRLSLSIGMHSRLDT